MRWTLFLEISNNWYLRKINCSVEEVDNYILFYVAVLFGAADFMGYVGCKIAAFQNGDGHGGGFCVFIPAVYGRVFSA